MDPVPFHPVPAITPAMMRRLTRALTILRHGERHITRESATDLDHLDHFSRAFITSHIDPEHARSLDALG